MRSFVLLLVSLTITSPATLRGCRCAHPVKEETTHWGGNEDVVEIEERRKQLQGIVKAEDGSPVSNVLVEVFTHPEYLLSQLPNDRQNGPEQQRVAACLTSADKFCFRHLPAAAYEIRSSVSSGWDVTHVHVTRPEKGES
jgi:hypothetical protein